MTTRITDRDHALALIAEFESEHGKRTSKIERSVTIAKGGMWEEAEWEIVFDGVVGAPESDMCQHCHGFKLRPDYNRHDYSIHYRPEFICPRIVVAENEGGYNTTGVCLDCILEAAASLPSNSGNTELP